MNLESYTESSVRAQAQAYDYDRTPGVTQPHPYAMLSSVVHGKNAHKICLNHPYYVQSNLGIKNMQVNYTNC